MVGFFKISARTVTASSLKHFPQRPERRAHAVLLFRLSLQLSFCPLFAKSSYFYKPSFPRLHAQRKNKAWRPSVICLLIDSTSFIKSQAGASYLRSSLEQDELNPHFKEQRNKNGHVSVGDYKEYMQIPSNCNEVAMKVLLLSARKDTTEVKLST